MITFSVSPTNKQFRSNIGSEMLSYTKADWSFGEHFAHEWEEQEVHVDDR